MQFTYDELVGGGPEAADRERHHVLQVMGNSYFNLPSDEHLGYPRFRSFEEREEYIKKKMKESPELLERLQETTARSRIIDPEYDDDIPRESNDGAAGEDIDYSDHDAARERIADVMEGATEEVNEALSSPSGSGERSPSPPRVAWRRPSPAGIRRRRREAERRPSRVINIPDNPTVADLLGMVDTVLVGEKTGFFLPRPGDLVIAHPGRLKPLDPDSNSRVTTFNGKNFDGEDTTCHEHGNIFLRIGTWSKDNPQVSDAFIHKPYEKLEAFRYNRDRHWTFLGYQAAMRNTNIPIDGCSLGKYLKVGSPVVTNTHFTPLVPRRGDIIIKSAVWTENFNHRENWRKSMVKWHRDKPVEWKHDDMLLRLLVGQQRSREQSPWVTKVELPPLPGDHEDCVAHGACEIAHPKPTTGFAELYRFSEPPVSSGARGHWDYWGRCKHDYETPHDSENIV